MMSGNRGTAVLRRLSFASLRSHATGLIEHGVYAYHRPVLAAGSFPSSGTTGPADAVVIDAVLISIPLRSPDRRHCGSGDEVP